MLGTLRWRFVLSHVLPLAIIIPVMGIALIYVLETQVLLGVLSQELEGQTLLAAKIAAVRPEIWHDPEQAQAFVAEVGVDVGTPVMLLDAQGNLLASKEPSDAERMGKPIELDGLATALAGETSVRTAHSQQMQREKTVCYDQLAALRPAGYAVTMNAGETLERFETLWSTANALEKKKLLRSAVAAVLIRGKLVRAIQLREAFHPFVLYRNGRNSGSDGIRTRDLRLDRPACSPLHYAPSAAQTIPQLGPFVKSQLNLCSQKRPSPPLDPAATAAGPPPLALRESRLG
jgi:hypothetical protein